jgi:hypothetical protein
MRRRRQASGGHAAGAARAGGVLLAWARDRSGAKVSALRLRAAERRSRAPFTCPGCGEELVPRLGPIRARHFAHRPGSRCPLTAPESALHLDAKERLLALCAGAFAGEHRVTLLARCEACRRVRPVDLGARGDGAEAEGAVGALRADVLVRARGAPALALEVRVTHAVDAAKEAALAACGLPFVEIDAREEWERTASAESEIACVRSAGFGRCAACEVLVRAQGDRERGGEAADIAELEAYRARGLFALPAGRARKAPGAGEAPLSDRERSDLRRRFRCPECGSQELQIGRRLARHACRGTSSRPVAWRGYDGELVRLTWWQREPRR